VLKLERHDIVLGVDWLKKYSSILFDFIKLRLSFKKEGIMIELKGISQDVGLYMITVIKEQRNFQDVIFGLAS
jgi:ribosomal protein S12 methylthiotransferase accessory factor YcaO